MAMRRASRAEHPEMQAALNGAAAAEVGTAASSDSPADEWRSLAQAKRELGLRSQAVVKAWIDLGWLRSRLEPDGQIQVLRADVMARRQVYEALTALDGRELTEEELAEMAEWQGRLPWREAGADPSR